MNMKLCDTCSKLPNYQQLKIQDIRQLAFFMEMQRIKVHK
jgi:hypothetical protein